ncbi:class I SAM-dependent methyltransferase [Lactobacillus sp. YT155]|uniref:class I SAM-dependent methyltransferase n=1 Tax=Lactobacillus sp. YT155 TaxID=3060955 RepID=UPI0026603054|nr:class I SAM-dependent methyltransferase [Lactobacillus sp. YT155]MDO1604444.1 class I SAM-dependent methyltransferase [Lactobacillus sp. YT155]
MAEQYFETNPNSEHNIKEWKFTLLDNELKFQSDNGVFSKNTVDFGSRVLISAFDESVIPEGEILDLGCGYGPIGLSIAKKFPDRQITMSDVNERALELAKTNAELNDIENVEIIESSVYDKISKKFAAILTNPPIRAGKEIVSAMVSDASKHLIDGGSIWVVIQKKQGAPSVKKLMQETFNNVEVVKKDKGYYILKANYEN